MRSFTGASPTPCSLKGGTTFFLQASFQGHLAFTILKRNGNPQTFHFRLSRNLVKWPARQRPQQWPQPTKATPPEHRAVLQRLTQLSRV